MYISHLTSLGFLTTAVVATSATLQPTTHWVNLRATNHSTSHIDSTTEGDKTYHHFACGTNITHASKDFLETSQALHHASLKSKGKGIKGRDHKGSPGAQQRAASKRQSTTITVNTYYHIVTHTDPTDVASITEDMVTNQIQAMNMAYNVYNIHFFLQNTTFTANDVWAVGASDDDDMAMKDALRQGTYADLNIYFQTDLSGGILGRCTLPSAIQGIVAPSAYANDGCNVNANTMPGGNIDEYNLGQTAVHETGHWLGLLHVFEDYTCDPTDAGDLIADTPQQSISTNGCPVNPPQDSCPAEPGLDSIHNIMDYSYDSCYEGFTNDQVARMQDLWAIYRSGN